MNLEVGMTLGKLTLIEFVGRDRFSKKVWKCKCECGNTVERTEGNLKQSVAKGKPPHCGCSPNWKGTNRRFKDLSGMRFGRLTVMELYGKDRYSHNIWLCKCDCGKVTFPSTRALESGKSQSCGCLRTELTLDHNETHGLSKHRLYRLYYKMIDRCENPKNKDFKDYGGRGIKIDCGWLNDFKAFYEWAMANGYHNSLTIERVDVNGNYEPSNCIWATRKKQSENKRNTIKITHNGKTLTLSQWAHELGLKYRELYYHIVTKGESIEKIIERKR